MVESVAGIHKLDQTFRDDDRHVLIQHLTINHGSLELWKIVTAEPSYLFIFLCKALYDSLASPQL